MPYVVLLWLETFDTPDLLRSVKRGFAYRAFERAIDGGAPRPLTAFTDRRVLSFAWSPDGKQLAVTRGSETSNLVC